LQQGEHRNEDNQPSNVGGDQPLKDEDQSTDVSDDELNALGMGIGRKEWQDSIRNGSIDLKEVMKDVLKVIGTTEEVDKDLALKEEPCEEEKPYDASSTDSEDTGVLLNDLATYQAKRKQQDDYNNQRKQRRTHLKNPPTGEITIEDNTQNVNVSKLLRSSTKKHPTLNNPYKCPTNTIPKAHPPAQQQQRATHQKQHQTNGGR
jgi:hypothetical protein